MSERKLVALVTRTIDRPDFLADRKPTSICARTEALAEVERAL